MILICSFASSQSIMFNGIPVGGNIKTFKQKMIQKGYSLQDEYNGEYIKMKGIFANEPSYFYADATKKTNTVYQVKVYWQGDSFDVGYDTDIEEELEKLHKAMISKYGEPTEIEEKDSSYNGSVLRWIKPTGTIEVIYDKKRYKSGHIYLVYTSKAGLELKEKEEKTIDSNDL